MAYTSPSLAASGLTFTQAVQSGAAGHLQAIVNAQAATAAPSNPTVTATGGGSTGGSLPAGTWYVKVTETNGIGETTPSGEVSVTSASGNIPQVTFASLKTGNVARNVYVGAASGAEQLYATGITAGTYNLSAALPANSLAFVAPPATNGTGLSAVNAAGVTTNTKLAYLKSIQQAGNFQKVWGDFCALYRAYGQGNPVKFSDARQKVSDAHVVFAALAQITAEFGTLLDANPGHLTTTTNAIGNAKTVRTQP